MSEYKHTVSKQQQGGFSESPVQTESNAGNPALNDQLTLRDVGGVAIATVYTVKLIGTVAKAAIGQTGNSEIERAVEGATRLAGLSVLAYLKPEIALLAIGADTLSKTVSTLVNIYDNNVQNERRILERGTLIDFGAGGYYD